MQKEAIRIDLYGYFVGLELVPLDTYGVTEIYEPPHGEREGAPELVLTGYRVAVPVTPGRYKPRFDIAAWRASIEEYDNAYAIYLVALEQYDEESEEDKPIPPEQVNLNSFWVEGLTQDELDEIRNRPIPKTTEEKLQDATKEISLLSSEKEALQQQLAQINTDFVAFMDFYFSQNPSEA